MSINKNRILETARNLHTPETRTLFVAPLFRRGEGGKNTKKIRVLERVSEFSHGKFGASDFTLHTLHQLEDFRSALMVSGASASEDGTLEKRLRGGNPHHVPAVLFRGP